MKKRRNGGSLLNMEHLLLATCALATVAGAVWGAAASEIAIWLGERTWQQWR